MNNQQSKRDIVIDAVRGFAVFTMIAANMSAQLLMKPHPLGFRLYGSFAAPLFTFIVGMMIAITKNKKQYGLSHYCKNSLQILFVALLLVTFVWSIYPYTAADVLTFIGTSIPITYLFLKCPRILQFTFILCVLVIAQILRQHFGYSEDYFMIPITQSFSLFLQSWPQVLRAYFFEGTFPFFPWIMFPFLGAIFAQDGYKDLEKRFWIFIFGSVIACCGILLWSANPQAILAKGGYTEMFYPATPTFMATAFGIIIMLFYIFKVFGSRPSLNRPMQFLQFLGKGSLFIYFTHFIIIIYVFPFFSAKPLPIFSLYYLAFVAVMAGLLLAKNKVMLFLKHGVRS